MIKSVNSSILKLICSIIIIFSCLLISPVVSAEPVKVAVASNFAYTLKTLAKTYRKRSGNKVTIISGSTGKLYAQLINGAPYDVYLAGDELRPVLLENKKLIQPGSRFTYALGQLALWSPDPELVEPGAKLLHSQSFASIAIANPKLAPYGLAAQQYLQKLKLWKTLKKKFVMGENISQTFHFIHSGHVAVGFIAFSQLQQLAKMRSGSFWLIPQSMYKPIRQQAVLITDNDAARDFMAFLASHSAKEIITQHGYLTE